MSTDRSSLPDLPPDSPGSSVSSRLMDEYDELLKYAVVVPSYDPNRLTKTLTDPRDSFPQPTRCVRETLPVLHLDREDQVEEGDHSPMVVRVTRENGLPDFGQSPIQSKDKHRDTYEDSDLSDFPQKQELNFQDEEEEDQTPRPIFTKVQREEVPLKQMVIEREEMERDLIYTSGVDPDVKKMEGMLDQWCLDLKRNVLTEYGKSKIHIVELGRQQLLKEQERHASEKTQLQNEIEGLKELLHTYETSIERKDQVISNMTHALQKQKEKFEMAKKFSEWKIKHNDIKRENFGSKLAMKHHERKLCRSVWDAWHSVIENKWRSRVERACQGKAQEVCIQLTDNYESKVKSLNEALESSRQEVVKLHAERDRYEEAMKKAFMRGVCALNLEAMTMFQNGEENQKESTEGFSTARSGDFSDNLEGSIPEKDFSGPKTIPQEPVYVSHPRAESGQPRVVTSQGSRSSTLSSMAQSRATAASKSGSGKGKVISARVSAKVDSGRPNSGLGGPGSAALAPPMSSVIVERHQPITKQTVGHAAASKHPVQKYSDYQKSGIIHRRIAGQSGPLSVSPNVQTVKVVE